MHAYIHAYTHRWMKDRKITFEEDNTKRNSTDEDIRQFQRKMETFWREKNERMSRYVCICVYI